MHRFCIRRRWSIRKIRARCGGSPSKRREELYHEEDALAVTGFSFLRKRGRAADAARRGAVSGRSRVYAHAGALPGDGRQVFGQEDQLGSAQELGARAGEAVLRVHVAGQGGRLRHRVAGAHVDLLQPIADEINQKAEVMLIGYAGGGTRNIFVNKPVRNLQEMKGLKVRVQGAPIWSRTFQAIGMAPTVIAYNEIYNAIQNNVISAGENEAAGVEQMKFYEVAPQLSITQHAITIRPICFSTKTFKKLDKNMQQAILRAGKEAGAYGRQLESSEDEAKLVALE